MKLLSMFRYTRTRAQVTIHASDRLPLREPNPRDPSAMTTPAPATCPACGAKAAGRFCSECGAALGARACSGCGQPLPAGARFCRNCGATAAGPGGAQPVPAGDRTPWIVAGVASVAFLGLLIAWLARGESKAPAGGEAQQAAAAPFAGGGGGAPPDIANMSPKERFDRLYNRVMRAAESGDEATVTQFAPMAVQAYGMLPAADLDADARYHVAMLYLHTGQVPAAKAVADTILKKQPGHLFGYMLKGSIARFERDDPALKAAYAGFLGGYDKEMKANRPEYGEHERAVADFRTQAQGGGPAKTGS